MPQPPSATGPCGLAVPSPPSPSPAVALTLAVALALALSDRLNRVMWLNNERVFYAGLLGRVSLRAIGAWQVYASMGEPIRVQRGDGDWQSTDLAVVPSCASHRVARDQRLIVCLSIEPETVDPTGLPALLRQRQGLLPLDPKAAAFSRVRQGHAWLRGEGREAALPTADFDTLFFGRPLQARRLDVRIARTLEDMRNEPSAAASAQQCAELAGLSFSRFLHLFKAEVGTPFRSLRNWKRARSLLHHVTSDAHLVHVALNAGYPDDTHFSHTIRQVYGLKPRDLFAGSRQRRVWGDSPPARAAAQAEAWR